MKKLFSEKIKKGDRIQIIAPSSSGATMKKKIHKLADKRTQKDLGLNISWSKHAFEKDLLDSSSIESRIEDLHEAFRNKDVKGIACVRGGYNANTLLPYIDWNLLRNNPKPIWGYSDITVLANAIYAKTGLVTYVGPNYSSFGLTEQKDAITYMFDYWKKCLMDDTPFEVLVSKYYGERNTTFKKNRGYEILQKGTAEGTLIGGHLSTLNLLQGTEYMPSLENVILFLEDDDFGKENTIFEFERNLESLLQIPNARIKGIVFGRFQKDSKVDMKKLKYLISSKKLAKNIPIIANANFGHTQPIMTFPVGGTVRIETKKGKGKIIVLEH